MILVIGSTAAGGALVRALGDVVVSRLGRNCGAALIGASLAGGARSSTFSLLGRELVADVGTGVADTARSDTFSLEGGELGAIFGTMVDGRAPAGTPARGAPANSMDTGGAALTLRTTCSIDGATCGRSSSSTGPAAACSAVATLTSTGGGQSAGGTATEAGTPPPPMAGGTPTVAPVGRGHPPDAAPMELISSSSDASEDSLLTQRIGI